MSHTILVVEDEVDLLFTVTLTLELAGYRVVPAKSGEEALAAVDEHEPDVVVLDLRLPGIDGWEVTRRLGERDDRRPIPVVSSPPRSTRRRLRGPRSSAVRGTWPSRSVPTNCSRPSGVSTVLRTAEHLLVAG